MNIFAYYDGLPDYRDEIAQAIFEKFNCRRIGAGTDLMNLIRDIQYDVSPINALKVEEALIAAGFRTELEAPVV
jgi:hypothetical protein